ncbi:unnamed protein product [Fusarium graminearum]|uniref:Uncharacterized protein n=1 Tax=Gibberella zeae TaxID=5518 RepID=A0A9N8RGR6_GIBZA|nr:unnamed protein product [Fusarium graminearum]
MCQLSTTAMICEQCRRLITYASVKSFCSTEECMKKLQDSSQYVSCLTCNKCNPSGKGLEQILHLNGSLASHLVTGQQSTYHSDEPLISESINTGIYIHSSQACYNVKQPLSTARDSWN